MPNPKIAVVMTSYNRPTFLKWAVKCVQAQTLKDWKLYVMDNSSPQVYPQIVNALQTLPKDSDRILLDHMDFPNEVRVTQRAEIFCRVVNRALFQLLDKEAYVQFACDDGFMYPQKLQLLAGYLDAHLNSKIAAGVMEIVDFGPKAQVLGWTPQQIETAFQTCKKVVARIGDVSLHLTGVCMFDWMQLMIRRELINTVGPLCGSWRTGGKPDPDAEFLAKAVGHHDGVHGLRIVLDKTFTKTRSCTLSKAFLERCERGEILE